MAIRANKVIQMEKKKFHCIIDWGTFIEAESEEEALKKFIELIKEMLENPDGINSMIDIYEEKQ